MLALPLILLTTTNPALAQEKSDGQEILNEGVIKLTKTKLCLEPSDLDYSSINAETTHTSIRACIAAGGVQPSSLPDDIVQELKENEAESVEIYKPDVVSEMTNPSQDLDTETEENTEIQNLSTDALRLNEEKIENDKKIIEAIFNLNIMGPLGSALSKEEITPEKIEELKKKGTLPDDLQLLLNRTQESTKINIRKGPSEIELPEKNVYSDNPSLFQPPESYVGRNAKDFKP
jgi:hypothetical protein